MDEPQYHLTGVIRTKEELLEDFEGPLDLILLLLSKNKIEISDISISSILEQYLAYLEEMKRMDMEIAAEFISMASHLMQIKTKMLLSYSEREEALTEMELLIQSLEARQRAEAREQIHRAMEQLEARSELGRGMFVKPQEPYTPDGTYRYSHEREDLLRAMQSVAERSEQRLPPPKAAFEGVVGRESYPVTKKAAEVLRRLLMCGTAAFRALFQGSRSRSEIVATFLAVLELSKQKSVDLTEDTSGEVSLKFVRMPDEDQAEFV